MFTRAVFLLVTTFWVTMNVLLWRQEFGSRHPGGSAVPVETVWQKILTAPDTSALVLLQRGKRIGFCQWATSVGDSWAAVGDENLSTSLPTRVRGYGLRFEGNAFFEALTNRVHAEGRLKLSSARQWQELTLQLSFHESDWTIRANAKDQTVRVQVDANGSRFDRVFRFSDLQDPATLLGSLLGPDSAGVIGSVGLPGSAGSLPVRLNWEAREEIIRLAHSDVRVYRLRTRLFDTWQMNLLVSRVGEILRLELPGDLVFINDQLPVP